MLECDGRRVVRETPRADGVRRVLLGGNPDLLCCRMLRRNMVCMSSATHDFTARLEDALDRRGNPLSVDGFLDLLREASDATSESLSAGEREFLLETTDLTEDDLTPAARTLSQSRVARDRAAAQEQVHSASLTTAEVATLLERHEASVRRSKATGDLYALPSSGGRMTRFPRWQFGDGEVVPGLRAIIPAFPQFTHPLSIQRFMTAPNESLDQRSPVRWLLDGGQVDAVVSLVEELGYE